MLKREIISQWIDKALPLKLHSKLYIPVESKAASKKILSAFNKELSILAELDPENAGTLFISTVYKEKHFWIVIEKVIGNPLVGFIREPDGEMVRITINCDPERERRITLMFAEGYTVTEVEKAEGKITESEKLLYKKEKIKKEISKSIE